MKYKFQNRKTGAVIETSHKISGENWVQVKEPAKKETKTQEKKSDAAKKPDPAKKSGQDAKKTAQEGK